MHKTDVAIVGAGPVGLFAIFECGMLGLKCHVIDALDVVGGQCMALYPEKPIYDIPAHPSISGSDLVHHLERQAASFSPVYHLGAKVSTLQQQDDYTWLLTTDAGSQIQARAVIVAGGAGAFGPNRPPLPHIELFEGTSVHYYIKSKENFRDQRVVIAGGGDSAVDWAISLADVAAHVAVVHRRAKFRAAPESERQLKILAESGKIELVTPYQLYALNGEAGKLSQVIVQSLGGENRVLDADVLLPFFGLSMNLGPIAEWGLGLDRQHITIDPLTAATSRPGIYAIGDIATYPHKLKLILTGFAEAAQAAHAIRAYLFPHDVFHFEHSTTKGVGQLYTQ